MAISRSFITRTNYTPIISLHEYKSLIQGFNGDNWIEYYKLAFRKMLNQSGERTLISAILPPNCSHINGAVSLSFRNNQDMVELAGLSSSLVFDFYMKIMGAANANKTRLSALPLGVCGRYRKSIAFRTLALNCLTEAYSSLWSELWDECFLSEDWSIVDGRLKSFDTISKDWTEATPLRNHFERRFALVELDVIVAMSLGLSLSHLETIYHIQFPVLQQNENDTWYDSLGNIVFTCSAGLKGVGLDRKIWEQIRGEVSEDGMTYAGTSETYEHTIDPAKSELYGGQKVTYYAPYNRCDRIEDYRRAWAHFEKVFNEEK